MTVKLHPAQQAFRRSSAPYRAFVGGRGAGKTWAGAYDLIRRAERGRTYLIAAPTNVLTYDVSLPKFSALARELGVWDDSAVRHSPYPTARLTTGATVRFRTADEPERLRGSDLSGVWLDEASLMSRAAFDVCIGSLREAGARGWLSATFTPRGLTHWSYEVFGIPRPDAETFHASSYDNPFLPADFAAGLAVQYGSLRALQEVHGRFMNVEGAEWDASYFSDAIWFDHWPPPASVVRSVLAIDVSKGVLRGDYQALVLLRLDAQGVFWVDCEAHRLDPVRLLAKAIELVDRWRPDLTVVESNSAGYYILDQLSRANVGGLRPAVVGRHHGSDSNKVARIVTRLTSQWARGTIRLRRGSAGCQMLLAQARDFPEADFDDLLDALELGMELLGQIILPKDRRNVPYEVPRA
jgi:phage terminase large subunit-like protein